jgi:hypothetical protein
MYMNCVEKTAHMNRKNLLHFKESIINMQDTGIQQGN